MKKTLIRSTVLIACIVGIVIFINNYENSISETSLTFNSEFKETFKKEDRRTTNEGRTEYFRRLLMDPVTKQVPENYRTNELAFANELQIAAKNTTNASTDIFQWTEIGPFDVGGRTRGFGIDQRNANIMLAGGVSGGIWKTTNGGVSWEIKSDLSLSPAVSSIIQDPTNLDRWYYATGEIDGNSASARGGGAFYSGIGVFVSNDNGESWDLIDNSYDGSDISCCGRTDMIEKITISPTTGSIFYAANLYGIFRTRNAFETTPDYVLGGSGDHFYADVEVNSNGVVIAVVSASFISADITSSPGVYISTNDGDDWTNITPNSFPVEPGRSVIGLAPSNPNIFYILNDETGNANDLTLLRFDISDLNNIQVNDRSAGIPNFGGDVGDLDPQGGYNLMVKVHPTDADMVFIGGTNLFRSFDGFSSTPDNSGGTTLPSESDEYWIGGYSPDNDISQYTAHHPDQHNLVFDPTNPDRAISLHDGGISVTEDITAAEVTWTDLDDGYNVTQYYTISVHPDANDPRIGGGAQDNGSPYFLFDIIDGPSNSIDPSSGDGAFNYVGKNLMLTSSQRGVLTRYEYNGFNLVNFSYLNPPRKDQNGSDILSTLFIHPVAVNPSNESFVYYPDGNQLWRNNQAISLPRNTDSNGSSQGWTELTNVNVAPTHSITALEYSTSNPSNRLYFGGSDGDLAPIIKRMDSQTATDGEIDISIPGADAGGYVHDIAVNPENGDEVVVIISNYNVESVWYSADAGANWTAIGGSLEGNNGPSARSAAFAPSKNETFIFVGTSIGLFFTDQPNGSNTTWTQAGANVIGNVVIADLDYRTSDEMLAVGTHGRGAFIGDIGIATSTENPGNETPELFSLQQNYPNPFNPSTTIEFNIQSNSTVSLTIYDISGREIAKVLDNEMLSSGDYSELFNASSFASGTYLYRLDVTPTSGGAAFTQTKSMTLIK